jgi:hypothetical protein
MHHDPTTGGPRTAADTLSLLPLINQPATDPVSEAVFLQKKNIGSNGQ